MNCYAARNDLSGNSDWLPLVVEIILTNEAAYGKIDILPASGVWRNGIAEASDDDTHCRLGRRTSQRLRR